MKFCVIERLLLHICLYGINKLLTRACTQEAACCCCDYCCAKKGERQSVFLHEAVPRYHWSTPLTLADAKNKVDNHVVFEVFSA